METLLEGLLKSNRRQGTPGGLLIDQGLQEPRAASHVPHAVGPFHGRGSAAAASGWEMEAPGQPPRAVLEPPGPVHEQGAPSATRQRLGLGPVLRESDAPPADAERGSEGGPGGEGDAPRSPQEGVLPWAPWNVKAAAVLGSCTMGQADGTPEVAAGRDTAGGGVPAHHAGTQAEQGCRRLVGVSPAAHRGFSLPLGDLLLRGPCKPSMGTSSPSLGSSQETAAVGCGRSME